MNNYIHPKALVESSHIGHGTRIWAFAHILKGAVIGRNCNIGDHCYVEGMVSIGNDVTLKNGVAVWDKVKIEDSVFIGPHVVFTNDLVPRSDPKYKHSPDQWLETTVRFHSTIGANATILCGIEIGTYCFIAAGSVVTKSVKPHERVMGNPAVHAGWVCNCGELLTEESPTPCCGTIFGMANKKPQFIVTDRPGDL